MIEYINPSSIARAANTYTNVAKFTGGTQVVVAGQVPMDETGNIVGISDIEAQTHQVLKNIRICLEAAGANMNNVISRNSYITNMADVGKILQIFRQYFDNTNPPAGTLVQVVALNPPGSMIEVEVTAVID
jgi:enamine deaminase RidA (YjgF/YER057c/UK114 family)